MRKKLTGKLLLVIIAGVLIATLVPAVSAYESHMVNVQVHVKERPRPCKHFRLADWGEICEAKNMGCSFSGFPNPSNVCDPDYVPTRTCVVWVCKLTFTNTLDYPITDLEIDDCFPAELDGQPLDWKVVDTKVRRHSRGAFWEQHCQTQSKLKWYPTYRCGDVSDPDEMDNSGYLYPGESCHLEMFVWTKPHSWGCPGYFHPGCYCWNPGAWGRWRKCHSCHGWPDGHDDDDWYKDRDGRCHSRGNRIHVWAHN